MKAAKDLDSWFNLSEEITVLSFGYRQFNDKNIQWFVSDGMFGYHLWHTC